MSRRQTSAEQWLIVTEGNRRAMLGLARKLPVGAGIILLTEMPRTQFMRLRTIAAARRLTITVEGRASAVRVHNLRELRRALLQETPLILLSPIFATRTHPDWEPIPRMRAAAYARLSGCRLIALGGMDKRRYAQVARLGFSGWAGVSAFRT